MERKNNKKKSGPKPDHIQFDMDWEEAMKKAVKKEKPAGGFPKKQKPKK